MFLKWDTTVSEKRFEYYISYINYGGITVTRTIVL